MTPQYILEKSLCRPASCGRHKEVNESDLRNARSEIENLQYATEFVEPGYTDSAKGILFANWNYFPNKVFDLLEDYGYSLEWSDEWYICDCGKAFRTSADSYSWQPSFAETEDGYVCIECLQEDPSDYLASLEDNPARALNLPGIDPADYGYTLLDGEYENGWHPGQNDNPEAIYETLRASGVINPILFQVDDVSQFSISFSVWEFAA